jgi:hypothetical protein
LWPINSENERQQGALAYQTATTTIIIITTLPIPTLPTPTQAGIARRSRPQFLGRASCAKDMAQMDNISV